MCEVVRPRFDTRSQIKIHVKSEKNRIQSPSEMARIILCWLVHQVASQWSSGPPLPTARSAFGIAAVGEMIYVIGGKGQSDSNPYNVVEVLNATSGVWKKV